MAALLLSLCLAPAALGFAIDYTRGNVTAEAFLRDSSLLNHMIKVREDDTVKRETPTCVDTSKDYYYEKTGDGDPHQNFLIYELANSLVSCPGSVSKGYSHSMGWDIGGGFSPGSDSYDFASLSFSVSETETTSTTELFNCDDSWAAICVLSYHAVTAVQVDFYSKYKGADCPAGSVHEGSGTVYLPNSNSGTSGGSIIGRGINTLPGQNIKQCKGGSADRKVTFYCGPPGGPEFYDNADDGPWTPDYMNAKEPSDCGIPIEAYHYTGGNAS